MTNNIAYVLKARGTPEWTQQEQDRCIRMHADGIKTKMIAHHLGRSQEAVRKRIRMAKAQAQERGNA